MNKFDWFIWINKVPSEIYCYQIAMINYNVDLIKLYSTCVKQNTAVMTANNIYSMLAA